MLRSLAARFLRGKVSRGRLPRHIAIIPDGNRRWARKQGLPVYAGHAAGYRVARRTLDLLWELGVDYVTFYALSRENCLRRPLEEREHLYKLLLRAIDDLLTDPRVVNGSVRVYFVGDFTLLPGQLAERLEEVNAATATNGPNVLTIATCYGGRWEVLETLRSLATKGFVPNDEEELRKLMPLGLLPEPDLLIRTGGELRLSGFLLYHVAYTELYFTRRLWPEFDEFELLRALRSYQMRERRFGR
ncbi:polyprenyl diphosphate synthase [Hyperthermus butylicus]|uniref:Tritrans,polycis-undecaprenyl-diphosphate synthase (geranylgeranyl-diphosphate specific) n=1 Tax=Hyperthermus butylicus (strain DSM 5456 / JCM 9403 / PLM1-5) TaxID=415426 RepID=A2BLR9_HYPBU|nr:polyprenyl diphosphate synthase [Hyperthermus butylicus]ABM80930.1 Undecaprenyl pyrophosphate synthetase [Hyperthermus butylicus DSM 5456]